MRKGVKLQNLLDGGQQERGHRGSTENVPGIASASPALPNWPPTSFAPRA